jgi:hypothetical protein
LFGVITPVLLGIIVPPVGEPVGIIVPDGLAVGLGVIVIVGVGTVEIFPNIQMQVVVHE